MCELVGVCWNSSEFVRILLNLSEFVVMVALVGMVSRVGVIIRIIRMSLLLATSTLLNSSNCRNSCWPVMLEERIALYQRLARLPISICIPTFGYQRLDINIRISTFGYQHLDIDNRKRRVSTQTSPLFVVVCCRLLLFVVVCCRLLLLLPLY